MVDSSSPPLSFHSAMEEQAPMTLDDKLNFSTPPPFSSLPAAASITSSKPNGPPSQPRYRPARELAPELREQITIYFEEGLYSQALNLLLNLLTAGSHSSRPAFIPSPSHLSLILTLSIHPSFSTRAKTLDLLQSSDLALQYLRALNDLVGPFNARLREAYSFTKTTSTSRRPDSIISRRKEPKKSDPAAAEVQSELAQDDSLFTRSNDFWSIVGFALNCSILNETRWKRWRLWLHYMLDVLETDWLLAEAEDEKANSNDHRVQSLLAKYAGGKGAERRIVRAVLVDGSSKCTNEFPELWKNECRERKTQKKDVPIVQPEKKAQFGNEDEEADHFLSSPSSSEDEAAASPKSPTTPGKTPTADSSSLTSFPNGSLYFGDHASLLCRSHLLSLLFSLSTSLPTHFTSLSNLYSLITSEIRPLPLTSFLSFFSTPTLAPFTPETTSSLIQCILRSLLEPAAPSLQRDDNDNEINWSIFSEDYALWAAAGQGSRGTVGENMKVGILIEALVFLMVEEGVRLEGEEGERESIGGSQSMRDSQAEEEEGITKGELWEAVKSGCRKRLDRARAGGGKRGRKGEKGGERKREEERAVESAFLAGAEERLRVVLGMGDRDGDGDEMM